MLDDDCCGLRPSSVETAATTTKAADDRANTHTHTHVHRKPEPVGPLADVSANACEHSIAYENVFSRALCFVKQPIVGAVRTH